MAKFKIIFEKNELKSCAPTKKFIGDREKNWPMHHSVTKSGKKVEMLITSKNQEEALKIAKDFFISSPAFRVK